MKNNNFTEMKEVQQYYTERILENLKNIGGHPIIWHDPIDFGVVVRVLLMRIFTQVSLETLEFSA